MQQASVGGCDEGSAATSPPARSPAGFAIKSEPVADRNDVRIKIEMPEPTEAGVEVKGEPREDYQRQPSNDNYRFNDKKPGYVPDILGQCQPGYRPVGLPNSFGFPPFYGQHHPAPMMPATSSSSFSAGRPSPDGPIGKIADGHEQSVSHVDRHAAYGGMPPIPNDGFLQEHHQRFDPGDFQHVNAGVPYPGFRPTLRTSYGNHHHHHHHHQHPPHQNNSAYNRGHYHPARQRKWSSAAFRGLHPPMPTLAISLQNGTTELGTRAIVAFKADYPGPGKCSAISPPLQLAPSSAYRFVPSLTTAFIFRGYAPVSR
ncbi:hypothetical protein EAG_15083 [Camponotus floridanus]|uniref:Uncharacterized protein n=1 Tax=Camponotus floridanus TaxID=104421 RepID=E2AGY6_CAMFO|nr:hypothetical protein EAG_15083 [Camponotus floridanus]